jgi:hypothetical protein
LIGVYEAAMRRKNPKIRSDEKTPFKPAAILLPGSDEVKYIFNIIFEKNIELVEENLIIGVYEGEITEDLLLVNFVICILKWVIWKTRNYIKYNKSIYREEIVITNLKNELRSNIQMMIKKPEVRNLYNIMKLQLLLDTL